MRNPNIHEFAAPVEPGEAGSPAEPDRASRGGSAGEKPKKPAGDIGPGSAGEKKDLTHLLDLLASLIRTTSGKRGLHVTTQMDLPTALALMKKGQNPDEVWFAYQAQDKRTGKKIEYVHVPPQILEAHEDIAKGKAAHEGGHIAITRGGEFIPDAVIKETGFPLLMHAAEERPTDHVVRERYPGAGDWVDIARRAETEKAAAAAAAGQQLGYMPKFMQLCDLVVYGPHYRQFPAQYDPEVIAAYERLKPEIERMERTLPPDGAEEPDVLAAAKNRYRMVYKKLWPAVRHLVTEDLKDEVLRQMAGGASKDDIMKQLPEELQKELEKALEDGKTSPQPSPERRGGTGEEGKGEGERSGDEQGKEKPSPGRRGEGEVAGKESGQAAQQGGGSGAGASPIDMQKMSEQLKEVLQQLFDALPKTVQQALREAARKAFEKLEDTVVQQMQARLLDADQKIPTHRDIQDEERREADEARRQEEEQKIEEDRKRIKEREEKIEKGKTAYDRAYDEVRQLDEILYRRLEEIFTPNIKRKTRLASSGARLNLPAVFRWKSGKAGGAAAPDYKIFERVHIPEKRDYAFAIVVDVSSSMAGTKIEETFKAVVLLSEVLNRLGIPFEVIGFSDDVYPCKAMDKPLDDKARSRIDVLSRDVNGTATDLALDVASHGMTMIHAKEKFILCLTDGGPNDPDATHAVISRILTETDQKLVGIGLGPDTDLVEEYFPAAVPNLRVDQLPEALGALLEDVILHPEKYTYRS